VQKLDNDYQDGFDRFREQNHNATIMKPIGELPMATVTFKNIPDDLYEQLKQAASAHHRSLNSELIYCLEKMFKPTPVSAAELAEKARVLRGRVAATQLDIDEIVAAKNQGRA
jgi:plasmid stability protein